MPRDAAGGRTRIVGKGTADALLMLAAALLCLSVFLFFKGFFDFALSDFATEILAAMLGSIITVMITMLLIRRQGTLQQAHRSATESRTKVFETKLRLYREFIATYISAALDGKLTADELGKLEELALIVTLLTRRNPAHAGELDLGQSICGFVLQLQLFGLVDEVPESKFEVFDEHFEERIGNDGRRELFTVTDIMKLMKVELGAAQVAEYLGDEDDHETEFRWADELLGYREYRAEDRSRRAETVDSASNPSER